MLCLSSSEGCLAMLGRAHLIRALHCVDKLNRGLLAALTPR